MVETNFGPGTYALQAYDAVNVIVQAQVKRTLLEGIQSTKFDGLSSHVQHRWAFDGGGLFGVSGHLCCWKDV